MNDKPDRPKQKPHWRSVESVPTPLTTSQFIIEPLSEDHAELDYQALMSCRSRLRTELRWGDWPSKDFTLDENRQDLRRHNLEFQSGQAFAYTVLQPDRQRCLGCIYVEPCDLAADAQLAFWVVDDAIGFESSLVSSVVKWLHRDWLLKRIVIPLRTENSRGMNLASELGYEPIAVNAESELSGFRCFCSEDQTRS